MKRELIAAVNQLSAERNLSREVVLSIVESALASAYKKYAFHDEQDVVVKLDPDSGEVKVYVQKTVAESVSDPEHEISLAEARKLRKSVQVGETVEMKPVLMDAGRIAVHAAKQVILQRLREAEHQKTYEEFSSREGEIATGVVQFIGPAQIYVNLGKVEAILPAGEQIPNERYRVGQRLRFYLLKIIQAGRGTQIVVSRTHPNLLRRLFELEIPEVHSGAVRVEAIVREPGYRSKVAISTTQEGIDPIGSCLGARGIRLQNIIKGLNNEKIDLISWGADPKEFITNALSPAQVANIELNEGGKVARVIVPDRQLSLAIGKEGQNARLAARLTGWRIDIKSVSAAEAEKAEVMEAIPEELAEEEVVAVVEEETKEEVTVAAGELEVLEPVSFPTVAEVSSEVTKEELVIRFAEDILPKAGKVETLEEKVKLGKAKGKAKGKVKAKVKAKAKGKPKAKGKAGKPRFEEEYEE
jgi:N utilization substance protein A